MDKDRLIGVGKQVVGSVKQAFGKLIGDAKLQVDARRGRLKANSRMPPEA